jgi:DNA-directed RNA polymerase subunit RPC12/RpoP
MKTLQPPQRERLSPYREIECNTCDAKLLVEEGDVLKPSENHPDELWIKCPHCGSQLLTNPYRRSNEVHI